ncbi:MAG: hypothetical protein ACM3WT_08135 [Bacillota bacterium]
MNARIRLNSGLHVYDPLRRQVIEVESGGGTVREALLSEGFPIDCVWLVVAGDTVVNLDHVLADGEEVCVYPPADGG